MSIYSELFKRFRRAWRWKPLVNFSFIHCGDIHLGHLQYGDPERMLDFAQAFKNVVDYALANKVHFILICGDFFHKRAINAETLGQAVELLSPLKDAGIPVIAIEGNHDKAFYQDKNSWLWFLNQQGYLFLLTPQFTEGRLIFTPWDEKKRTGSYLDLETVRIYGLGYLGITTGARLLEAAQHLTLKKEKYTILMLHAAINRLLVNELGGVRREALDPLVGKVDYLALGHIHNKYELEDWIYNPGSLECVHLDEYDEKKEKGFYHITLIEEKTQVTFVNNTFRPVFLATVTLKDTYTLEEAYEAIYQEIKHNPPPPGSQVQIVLQGEVSFNPLQLELNIIKEKLKSTYMCLYVEILNGTNLPQEVNFQVSDVTIKREEIEKNVYRKILSEEKIWIPIELEDTVTVVKKVKDLTQTGFEEEEILAMLREYGPRLLKDELPEKKEA